MNVNEFYDKLNNGEIEEMTNAACQWGDSYHWSCGRVKKMKLFHSQRFLHNDQVIANITRTSSREQSILNVEEEEQPSAWVTFLTSMIPFVIIFILILLLA